MAKAAGVTDRTVRTAKTAEKLGLGDAARDGKVTAREVEAIAKAPPKVQTQAKAAIEKGDAPSLPAKKTAKPAAVDASEIESLRSENTELRQRIEEMAAQLEEAVEENVSLARVAEADDKCAAALAEAKRYREQNRILSSRIDGLMNEKNAMLRAAKSWQRKAEKAGAGIPKANGAHA
jgi:hypothetical protein